MEPQAVRSRKMGLEGHQHPILALPLPGPRLSHSCLDPYEDWWLSDTTLPTCVSLQQSRVLCQSGSTHTPSARTGPDLHAPLPWSILSQALVALF